MIYRIFQFWSNLDGWVQAVPLVLLLVVCLSVVLRRFMRWALVIPVALEVLAMSPWYACHGFGIYGLLRVANTANACNQSSYSNYLLLNFGLDQWYVLAGYGAIALLFTIDLVVNIIKSIRISIWTQKLNADIDKSIAVVKSSMK